MARKVVWSDEAIADLGTIVRYIAADNRRAAEELGMTVFDRTRVLSEFPFSGRIVPEERNQNVREIIVDPYRVIYEVNVEAGAVEILRVWHAARGRPEV